MYMVPAPMLMLQCCVRLSSVYRLWCGLCIVAKQCVLQQKLLSTAYRKSYMRNRLVSKWMTLKFVAWTNATHLPLKV